jgi:monofunctional biosynthetic peptidoglycan transglycosylase
MKRSIHERSREGESDIGRPAVGECERDPAAAAAVNESNATAEDAGDATADGTSSATPDDHGAAMADDADNATAGIADNATAKDRGAATEEDRRAASAEGPTAASADDHGAARADDTGAATADDTDATTDDALTATVDRTGRRRLLSWAWKLPLAGLLATVLLVLPFRWIAPPTSAFIELYGGSEARSAYAWVDWDDISPNLALAVIASEDQRFPTHHGVDLGAIRAAIEEESGRGASTISQQVAKNLYLWAGRSWIRKGLEAYLTLWIEALWPKKRILEVYLNVAQFGPTTYGVGAASGQFFRVPPSELTERNAALLAVVLPSPRRMSPARPSAYMEERAAWVQQQMRMLGGTAYLRLLD